MRRFVAACSLFVTAACGGSGVSGGTGGTPGAATGGGSSAGDCPDVSGTWEIAQHCQSSFVGASATVSQTGCSYEVSSVGYSCSGTVSADASVTQTCSVEEGNTVSCSGQVTEGTMILVCTGECSVVLQQQQ